MNQQNVAVHMIVLGMRCATRVFYVAWRDCWRLAGPGIVNTRRRASHARSPLRCAIWLCLIAMVLTVNGAVAENTDDALRSYAVDILRAPGQPRFGTGVYLGNGLVITAAHVVSDTPIVRIAGLDLPATIVKRGAYELEDLSLLSVDQQKLPADLRQSHVRLCQGPPWPDDPVIVVVPEGTARSHIMSPRQLPFSFQSRFSTLIRDVATTGNSGSGVFAAGSKCLLGIMSRKITSQAPGDETPSDIAKYFVPFWTIREFLLDEDRQDNR